jgi:sulfide:quinone oxidoreductase
MVVMASRHANDEAGARGGFGAVRRAGPFRIVIAGGGVAAVEAVLALREAAGRMPEITLLAPVPSFSYRAMAAVEPFGLGETRVVPLSRIASDLGAVWVEDLLARIDGERMVAVTGRGDELPYDALLVAIGTRSEPAIPGALTYRGPESEAELRELLDSLRAGEVRRLAFAVPPVARWSLPLYELAVLTARFARGHGVPADLAVVTHEHEPLELFGPQPSDGVRQLLAIEEVALHGSVAPVAARGRKLHLANGEELDADAVVALPRLVAPPIPGLPQGPGGFVATDGLMRVEGLRRVWAVGDITWFPVKQGGLAAQQSDAAATDIARLVDPAVEPRPFSPVLRAALLTGWAPYYLRRRLGRERSDSEGGTAPLWWPPSKVAGRLLAPYLAELEGIRPPSPAALEDLSSPREGASEEREEDHLDALRLALTAADLDARGGDYAAALRWLDAAERLNLTLPGGYARKRKLWRDQRRLPSSPG